MPNGRNRLLVEPKSNRPYYCEVTWNAVFIYPEIDGRIAGEFLLSSDFREVRVDRFSESGRFHILCNMSEVLVGWWWVTNFSIWMLWDINVVCRIGRT